jgi:hypothetical protein
MLSPRVAASVLIVCLCGFVSSLAAQGEIRGIASDSVTDVPVPGAVLRAFAPADSLFKHPLGTGTSDGLGRFVLQLNAAQSVVLVITRLGYFPDTLRFERRLPRLLAVKLRPGGIVLPAIEVQSRAQDSLVATPILQRSRQQLHAVPAAAAVDDPVRALAFEPGVALASPYSARLAVRGSAPDELGFFLDGFPVLNAVQLGGVFSGVPSAAVTSLTLWGTNSPYQLPGFSGGALDARTLPEAGSGVRGNATLNVMAAELAVGWSPSSSAAVKAAGRHSWLPMVLEDRTERDAFSLSDYTLSADVSPLRGVRLFGLAYRSGESRGDSSFGAGEQRRLGHYERFGRTIGAGVALSDLKGLDMEARAWDARASASGSHLELFNFEAADASTMRSRGVSSHLSVQLRSVVLLLGAAVSEISAGSDVRYTSFLDQLEAGRFLSEHRRTWTRAHVGLDFQPRERLRMHAGFAGVTSAGESALEPSVSMNYDANSWRLTASLASRTQLLFQMTDPRSQPSGSFSIVDAWMISGDAMDPANGWPRITEVATAATWSANERLHLTGQLFYRKGKNHPVLDISGLIANGPPRVLDANESSRGISFGGELAFAGATFARLSYTWSSSRLRTVIGSYASEFDVPHRLTFLIARQPVRGLRLSLTGAIQSGELYTTPEWGYQIPGWRPPGNDTPAALDSSGVLIFSQPNYARTRLSHRVDVEAGFAGQVLGLPIEVFAAALNVTRGASIPPHLVVSGGQGSLVNRISDYSLPPVPLIGLRLQF